MGLNFWSMQGTLGRVKKRMCLNFLVNHPHGTFTLKIVQPALGPLGIWVPGYKQLLNYMQWLCGWLACSWTKKPSTFQGHSGTYFPFFKDSIQCKKEPWVYVFFSSFPTCAILYWKSFCVRWVGQSLIPPKFKDFPALIAIFEAFQGLEFVF